jgi:hypothetical protein
MTATATQPDTATLSREIEATKMRRREIEQRQAG